MHSCLVLVPPLPRKSLNANPNPNQTPLLRTNAKRLILNHPKTLKPPKLPNENVKKILNLFGPERVEHLKSKMPELKNKCWDFDPRLVTCWGEGVPVYFMFLCLGFDMISKESGLIVKMDILCNVLRTVMDTTADDVLPIVYLLANRIVPAHEGLELGIREASIINMLAEAYGRTKVGHRKLYNQLGDWGLVAKACRSSQSMMSKPNALTVTKVFNTFHLIAKESGKDSQEKKKNHIKGLLVAASDCEPLYLIHLLQANLLIGLAEQTLLAVLGQATVYAHSTPPPNIQYPLEEHLYGSFEEEIGYFQFANAITSNDLDEIQEFQHSAVDARYPFHQLAGHGGT